MLVSRDDLKHEMVVEVRNPNRLGRREILTDYVRAKVRGKGFSDIDFSMYLDILKSLENAVVMWGAGPIRDSLQIMWKREYPGDYEAILKELRPDEYKKYADNKESIISEEEKIRKGDEEKMKAVAKKAREEWLALGGKE